MDELEELVEMIKRGAASQVAATLDRLPDLAHARDDRGAAPLHYATLYGQHEIVRLLVERGANVNTRDNRFGATPAGWAIEYLRELGAFLAIELDDLAFAIEQEDVRWVSRLLERLPGLKNAHDENGVAFRDMASKCTDARIKQLFEEDQP